MARLRNYYGPPDFEQRIIDAIRAGKAPGRYTARDIIEDNRRRKKKKNSLSGVMGGLRPPGYVSGGY